MTLSMPRILGSPRKSVRKRPQNSDALHDQRDILCLSQTDWHHTCIRITSSIGMLSQSNILLVCLELKIAQFSTKIITEHDILSNHGCLLLKKERMNFDVFLLSVYESKKLLFRLCCIQKLLYNTIWMQWYCYNFFRSPKKSLSEYHFDVGYGKA